MRNASKNTIKRVMRNAVRAESYNRYWDGSRFDTAWNEAEHKSYFLFNEIGAQIYRMSKGKICNRSLKGATKYVKP